ncbi:MAG: sulfatase-like hydrolase/transferase [Pseudomonadales bacterium]
MRPVYLLGCLIGSKLRPAKFGVKTQRLHYLLQIFSLTAFAIAQPVYNLVGRDAEFFFARQSQANEIVWAVVAISVFLPFAIALPGLLLGKWVRLTTLLFLTSILAATALVRYLDPSTPVFFFAITFVAVIVGLLAARTGAVSNFLMALAPAAVLFPLLFLFASPVSKLMRAPEVEPLPSGTVDPTPVVMVVFDELPLLSLLDSKGEIDKVRFPGFYDLSQNSTWFSNATTVAEHTLQALPALLTGTYPVANKIPDYVDHQHNLFTLLSPTHNLDNVNELMTTLCPRTLCWNYKQTHTSVAQRVHSILTDLSIVYSHLITPSSLRTRLPAINKTWGGFLRPAWKDRTPRVAAANPLPDDHVFRALEGTKPRWITRFLDRLWPGSSPGLHFVHIMLPHYPWAYLPDGRTYLAEPRKVPGLDPRDFWKSTPRSSREGYQRHLLQLGFADKVLVETLSRMRETSLFEDSILVVTSDHGASFKPGSKRRQIQKSNAAEIMFIPLFIKLPKQNEPVIDSRTTDLVDVVPTILARLSELPLKEGGGLDLFDDPAVQKRTKVTTRRGENVEHLLDTVAGLGQELAYKVALFGDGSDFYGLYRDGPFGYLVGKPISNLAIVEKSALQASIRSSDALKNIDLGANKLPVRVSGWVQLATEFATGASLIVSLNGTVAATTMLSAPNEQQVAQFSAILPSSLFLEGDNHISVYVPTRSASGKVVLLSPVNSPIE